MAKYEINHTCGHTSTVQLFGKCSERERKIEWMERQECPECREYAGKMHQLLLLGLGRPLLLESVESQVPYRSRQR